MIRRIITRPDFDGVVCAVLLKAALDEKLPVIWVQPNDIQKRRIQVLPGDVIANLPFHEKCALWFDHHVSNKLKGPFKGIYRVAPSAAGLIYLYYKNQLAPDFQILVEQTDKIDNAQLNLEEILHPERYPYILLSMTIYTDTDSDLQYCNHLVELLRINKIKNVMADSTVRKRCNTVMAENQAYEALLKQYTRVVGVVSFTDFRGLEPIPNGNRFIVYSLFPETVVNMKVFNKNDQTIIKVGHSILNRSCHINVGSLLAQYGGGGHRGAGACRLDQTSATKKISEILQILVDNQVDRNELRLK
jgi:oligoribonuclease NrnB/cAMP/cGMP phosphodiesterase (DHH superfamily)